MNRRPPLRVIGRSLLAVGALALVLSRSGTLGPTLTFLALDTVVALWLVSLFRARWRWAFLVHPVFVAASVPWFEISFNDIGTGYTYLGTFDLFVDRDTASVDWPRLIEHMFYNDGVFEWRSTYTLSLPYLWLPIRLFGPDVDVQWPQINYLSQNVSTVLYAAIGVVVARTLGRVPSALLLVVTLISTVSPTYLEMNSSLHRYSPMLLGLVCVWAGYLTILSQPGSLRLAVSGLVIALGLVLVVISKSPLLMSLVLFVVLERLSAGRLPVVSRRLAGLNRRALLTVALVSLALFQILSPLVAPEKYVTIDSQLGGEYPFVRDLPIIGFVLRVVYAQLAPFPIFGFTQWELYGGNVVFLPVHVASAVLATWIVLSAFLRIPQILQGDSATRVTVVFGFGILVSLAFGGIGYLVYIAPALPFLGVALIRRETRVPLSWAVIFVAGMELVAHLARVVRW